MHDMEQPEKSNLDNAGQNPAELPLSVQNDKQGAVASHAENIGDAALDHAPKDAVPSDKELAQSLNSLQSMPQKFSRSYLVPFTEHLLLMKRKKCSLREMLKWLLKNHGRKSNLSTLSYFLKKAGKEGKRLHRTQPARIASRSVKSAPDSDAAKSSHAPGPHLPPSSPAAEAREAIKAAKQKAEATESQENKPLFTFDHDQPLIPQEPKTN